MACLLFTGLLSEIHSPTVWWEHCETLFRGMYLLSLSTIQPKYFADNLNFVVRTSRTASSMLHMLLYRTTLFGKYFTVTIYRFLNYLHFPLRSIEIHLRSGCSQWHHLTSFTGSVCLTCVRLWGFMGEWPVMFMRDVCPLKLKTFV